MKLFFLCALIILMSCSTRGPKPSGVSDKSCLRDEDCGEGEVCATMIGVYPGSCIYQPP